MACFAGSAGNGGDQAFNFVAGFNDGFTPTGSMTRYLVGMTTGYDGADEDSNAYTGGLVAGTGASFMVGGGAVNAASNSFSKAGTCANWLTRLRHGGCFVAGTKVAVSSMPYSASREQSLWSETDWLEDIQENSFSPRPASGRRAGGEG